MSDAAESSGGRGVRGGAFAAITIYISNYTTNQCIRKVLPATT